MREPEFHFFTIVFGGIGKQNGITSRSIKLPYPKVSNAIIEALREADGIEQSAPILGVYYHGVMTEKEWNEETWQPKPQQSKTSQPWTAFQKFSAVFLVLLVSLVGVLVAMMYRGQL